MEFRPCTDIHNGKVKQIVGSSLSEENVKENFVSEKNAEFYANIYKENDLKNGHVILLNEPGTCEYRESEAEALKALNAYKDGLQIGGGITADNARKFLDAGAKKVIVTSFVFRNGMIDYYKLAELKQTIGRKRTVLDLSCKKTDDGYYVMSDRWKTFTNKKLDYILLEQLERYASEYLIHAIDAEGKMSGIDKELLKELAVYDGVPVTYAGGVTSVKDIEQIYIYGADRVNVTIGSALDLFGGNIRFEDVLRMCR